MKTLAYLQIAPKFGSNGKLLGIVAKKVGTRHPTEPLAGALVLKLAIEIPDHAFTPIAVSINVPAEAVNAVAKVEVKS